MRGGSPGVPPPLGIPSPMQTPPLWGCGLWLLWLWPRPPPLWCCGLWLLFLLLRVLCWMFLSVVFRMFLLFGRFIIDIQWIFQIFSLVSLGFSFMCPIDYSLIFNDFLAQGRLLISYVIWLSFLIIFITSHCIYWLLIDTQLFLLLSNHLHWILNGFQ